MKKIILILLLLFSVNVYSQIDTSVWSLTRNSSDGKYSLITNKLSFGGVGAGTITIPLTLTIADIDTSKYSLLRNNIDGKYSTAINKTSLFGIDSGMIKVSVSYNLNPPTLSNLGFDSTYYISKINAKQDSSSFNAKTNVENTWTATQTFSEVTTKALTSALVTMTDDTIRCVNTNNFQMPANVLNSNISINLQGMTDGQVLNVTTINDSTWTVAFTPTTGCTMYWSGGTPVASTGTYASYGMDLWSFYRQGTIIMGSVIKNFK